MTTAVQDALPALQSSISSSLDSHIHEAMQQQREQLQPWLQHQLGSRTDPLTAATQGQTYLTSSGISNYSSDWHQGGSSHGMAMTAPLIPGGGSVLPASLIADMPLMSVTSSTIASALGYPLRPAMPATGSTTNWLLSPHTPLGLLVSQAEASTKPKKAIVIGTSYLPIP